jgi:hypothetical protein
VKQENMNPLDENPLPCPAKPLWQEPPPSLGSGIPARVRSARPIPPRSRVTDLLPLHPPSFFISQGELRQPAWAAPDQPSIRLKDAEPAAVNLHTEYPSFATPVSTTPQIPASADLADWTAADPTVPSIAFCEYASSRPLAFPAAGSQRSTAIVVAAPDSSWQLSSTFFTPRRRIPAPEPAMRPLPVPESYCRPVASQAVRPTQIAGIVEDRPWKLVHNLTPIIADGQAVAPEITHQLANAHPIEVLRPRSVFHDTVPTWKTVPNSYVRRLEIRFLAHSASAVCISKPLLPAAH